MKRKTLKLVCLVLCIIVGIASVSVFGMAASNNKVYSDSVIAESGNQIEIPIRISNNSGFMGISIIVTYDSSVMTPISATKGNIISSGLFDDSIGTTQDNKVKIIWCGSEEVSSDGEICILKFNVNDVPSGEYKLKVSSESKNTFDNEYKEVRLNCEDITINVINNDMPVKQTFWQRIVNFFVGIFNWIKGLFA